MNLSDKITFRATLFSNPAGKCLKTEDVKEFIKKLKDCPEADFIERGQFNLIYFKMWIDKLAGKELANG